MKKSIYITALLVGCKLFSFAQDRDIEGLHVGGRFGLGESTVSCAGLQNTSSKLAISGGVAANYQFTKAIGLNADFLLTSGGVKTSGIATAKNILGAENQYSYKEKFDLVNAEIPVTGQLSLWMNDLFLKAYAGPGINFNLLNVSTRIYDDQNYNNNNGYINRPVDGSNNVSFSMIYGVGLGAIAKSNNIYFLDLRINRGLTPIGTINNAKAFANYYCITGGYVF